VVKELFESMGIGDDTTVVSYDSAGSLSASRFWWVLNYYGHKNAKVLDGGWKKWFDEGRPVSIEPPSPREVTFTPSADETLICTLDQAVSKIDDSDVVFLDVRSDGEWDGTNSRGNSRSGRVPGSVHLEWLNFITDDKYHTIKSPSELRDMLKTVGVTPEKEVITY
jgi:thiosulfate/3-mercaptopyruvate sulfurtransferase